MFLDANKREEILLQERMFGFLDSLVAHGEKTVDPCNSSIRRKGVCHPTDRRGEISLFATF